MRKQGVSLGHLLSEYISTETLSDVSCESCSEKCGHSKSLTFAKVAFNIFYMIMPMLIILLICFSYPHAFVFIFHELHGYQPVKYVNEKIMFIFLKVFQWHHTVLFNQVLVVRFVYLFINCIINAGYLTLFYAGKYTMGFNSIIAIIKLTNECPGII